MVGIRRYSGAVYRRTVTIIAVMSWLSAAPLRAADTPAEPRPQRIVSLNMCTDELVLRLADTARVASVTWLSQDPKASNVADLAHPVPANHGLAEEVIPLGPDLVVAGTFTTRTAVALLKQARFHVVEFGVPTVVADVERQIMEMAHLLDEPARGAQVVGDMQRRLEALGEVPRSPRPRAIVFNPNGFTVGAGTLVDDIMSRAGLDNVAAHMDLGSYSQIPLEVLVESAADVLIVSSSRDGPPSLATDVLKNPVLSRLGPRTHVVVLPSRLWTCAGPEVVEAVARLRAVADDIRTGER
jgi:iron complex transport system substrate-binding protein